MKKSNEQPLGEVLREFLEVYKLKSRLQQTQIQAVWARAMGAAIAKYTTEIKLRNGKLYLTITSASLRQELAFGREKIRKIINEELGEEAVEEVVVR